MRNGTPRSVLDELAAQPLLSACGRAEVRRVGTLGTRVRVGHGAVLMRQGTIGDEFCIVLSGHAYCVVDGQPVALFRKGGCFGEMALLGAGRRHATVITERSAELLVLDRHEFRHLLAAAPTAARTITAMCTARRRANCLAGAT
jgi:CRP-like cAMP-binding protein